MSIYNFHQKPDFLGQQTFTGDKSFTEFYETWKKRDSWQLRPQYKRFLDRKGGFALDYLFDFDKLGEEWPQICKILGLPDKELRSLNVSPIGARRSDVEPAVVEQIYSDYATDSQLVKQSTGFTACRDSLNLSQ